MTLEITRHGAVELLRFNRPEKKNALTGAMYDAATECLKTGEARGIKTFIFAGVKGAFTAGNDLKDFFEYKDGETPAFRFIRQLALNEIPLVAMVDGLAIGVGVTMLMHCDLVYASENAFFKMPFIDLGAVPEAASSLLMPQNWGLQKASQYLLLSDSFDAVEGEKLGIVNKVVPSESLENFTLSQAEKLAAKPFNAMKTARKLIRGNPQDLIKRMDEESEHFKAALQSAESKALFAAFLNKAK